MNASHAIQSASPSRLISALAMLIGGCLAGCSSNSPNYDNQMVFHRPEDAVVRFAAAVNAGDSSAMEAIFGTDARETLSSGDPVADRWNRQIVSVAMNERWTLEATDSTTRELVIGYEAWPFPIPLVKDSRGWWFDTAAGKEEILVRRIGRNELSAIATLRAYVAAQREYASFGRDGKRAGIFAQQIRSDPGTHNGLYWAVTGPKEPPSPFGEFIAAASAEGYGTGTKEGSAPYRGYYFRILKSQGAAGRGGVMEYVANGEMTNGFAMIAYPAQYGNSGVMSFIVGTDGAVYQADLGQDTLTLAQSIAAFNPDETWRAVH